MVSRSIIKAFGASLAVFCFLQVSFTWQLYLLLGWRSGDQLTLSVIEVVATSDSIHL